MKKIVFSLLLLITFIVSSCSMSPDQMLTKFNGTIYEKKDNGIYLTDGKPNISTTLLPKNTYRVMEHGISKIEVSDDYMNYKWTIKNNKSGNEFLVSSSYFANINAAVNKLEEGGDYSITLLVKNRNNLYFMDTATLLVVKNIYD